MNIAPFYLICFQIVIPLITLTVAMVRSQKDRLPRRSKWNSNPKEDCLEAGNGVKEQDM